MTSTAATLPAITDTTWQLCLTTKRQFKTAVAYAEKCGVPCYPNLALEDEDWRLEFWTGSLWASMKKELDARQLTMREFKAMCDAYAVADLLADLAGKVYRYPLWPAEFALRAFGPLFRCEDRTPIYHGDEFWCFYEGQKESANLKTANAKHDYNDGEPRFATKEQAREAIKVYNWLNE